MKRFPIIHADKKTDKRYSVQREFCGYSEARFVSRFCGEWLGQSEKYLGAVSIAKKHQRARLVAIGLPAIA